MKKVSMVEKGLLFNNNTTILQMELMGMLELRPQYYNCFVSSRQVNTQPNPTPLPRLCLDKCYINTTIRIRSLYKNTVFYAL